MAGPSQLKPPSAVSNPLKTTRTTAAASKTTKENSSVQPAGLKRKAPTTSSAPKKKPAVASSTASKPSKPSTATSTADAKKKRPAWDTKGRLEDMEKLTATLKDRVQQSAQSMDSITEQFKESESRVHELEQFRKSLEESLSVKVMENSEQQSTINKLKESLQEKEDEFTKNLTNAREQHSVEKAELERRLEDLQQNYNRATTDLASYKDQTNQLQTIIQSKTTTILSLESEMQAIKAKLSSTESTLEARETEIVGLKSDLSTAKELIGELENKIREEEKVRRYLHNTIQELKGNIRVFCRVRPPLPSELEEVAKDEVMQHMAFPGLDSKEVSITQTAENASGMKTVAKNHSFSFDKVFQPETSQATVFEEISQLVQSACDGYNVCIFAYGQTGSGKTFTMEGPDHSFEDPDKMGMIPRAVQQIWIHTNQLREKGWEYTMEGSFVEIYNESLRDLLGDGDLNKKHDIKHNPTTGKTTVTDMTIKPLTSPEEVVLLLKTAMKNRQVAETLCNERSSRSHSVFMLRITGKNEVTEENCEGVLNLIDLAGSERLAQSGSTGDRLKETQAINKSLSSLGDVIAALANKDAHIPYRNSKLTYLLQNSLGGNSKTLMFVNVSPMSHSLHETLSSLRFATKVNNCQIGTARRTVK